MSTHIWDLDPAQGFRPVKEYLLPGTEVLEGYIIHTLRPERFGVGADGDTVHLLSSSDVYEPGASVPAQAKLWHVSFRLPVVTGAR